MTHTIAVLSTGDEVCHGDILNTNSQTIAQKLFSHNLAIHFHMSVPDKIADIVTALRFLLLSHQAIIITGGLGPTSDDLTRFALTQVLEQELVFNEAVWASICTRLEKFGYPKPPESNKQQALFPTLAEIIPNPHGTAAGCISQIHDKFIFMLPGPPNECIPMIDNTVIPTLLKHQYAQTRYGKKWLLFGVSEGKIAEEIDQLASQFHCSTGYRLAYPYLEIKIFSTNQNSFTKAAEKIESHINPFLILDGSHTASQFLLAKLSASALVLSIDDQATGGLLQSIISTPDTLPQLHFDNRSHQHKITITGLDAYWHKNTEASFTQIFIELTNKNAVARCDFKIALRGKKVLLHAVEYICKEILNTYFKNHAY